jgi:hypothetical protein
MDMYVKQKNGPHGRRHHFVFSQHKEHIRIVYVEALALHSLPFDWKG